MNKGFANVLTATLQGSRIEASVAERGHDYRCPQCGRELILKKGRIKIPHFSHKPPTDCTWASGETQAHLRAKLILRDAFRARGLRADYEVPVLSFQGDRRADVLVSSLDGRARWGVEIQHTPILFDEMERRTVAYMAIKLPVLWLGILAPKMREDAHPVHGGLIIRQYSIRPWEKWAHALAFKELWYIDVEQGTLWRGYFSDHLIYVEPTSWYESGGEERTAGGYTRPSKRWRTLNLEGPFDPRKVHFETRWRSSWASSIFRLPAGHFARMVPD